MNSRIRIFVVFLFLTFICGVSRLLPVAILPDLALKFQAKSTYYGLIYGMFDLTAFFVIIIAGTSMIKSNIKFLYEFSLIFAGVSLLVFGLAQFSKTLIVFMGVALLSRILGGISDATFVLSSNSIILNDYVDDSYAFSILGQVFYLLGSSIGPGIGLNMAANDNFFAPFTFVGLLVILVSIFNICFSRKFLQDTPSQFVVEVNQDTLTFLKWPNAGLFASGHILGVFSYRSVQTMLHFHLSFFSISKLVCGVLYFLPGISFALTTPLWNHAIERSLDPNYISSIGSFLIFISLFFLGPAPFIAIDVDLWLTSLLLIFFGVGLSALFIASLAGVRQEVFSRGCPEETDTFKKIVVVWILFWYLGAFLGPTLSGLCIDMFGYNTCVATLSGFHLMLCSVHLCSKLFGCFRYS